VADVLETGHCQLSVVSCQLEVTMGPLTTDN